MSRFSRHRRRRQRLAMCLRKTSRRGLLNAAIFVILEEIVSEFRPRGCVSFIPRVARYPPSVIWSPSLYVAPPACWNGCRLCSRTRLLRFVPGMLSRPVEQKVIGYVASGYGKTDEKEVKGHIDRYKVRVHVTESVGEQARWTWSSRRPDRPAGQRRGP